MGVSAGDSTLGVVDAAAQRSRPVVPSGQRVCTSLGLLFDPWIGGDGCHNSASVVEVGPCLSSSRLFLKLLNKDRSLLLRRTHEQSSLVLITMKVLVDVLTTNLEFIFSFAIAAKGLLKEVSRKREILLGILISSYFKIFLLAMLVWKFPVSVIFIIDILVLTSNSMALRGQTFNY
ncbi:hypothetical protein F2Q69_00025617 [Brassica cretica]|uniref:Protein ARV n=1 Tax=Brassica cretica TaxID=69181 RepID=A0A8S9S229_BRACR|nr:hypothetical protein F2Q69_00025617 [Brassica cretica]